MTIKIYHNPQCKKSRAGLHFLQEQGISPVIVEYLKRPFTEKELEKLLVKLNKKPSEVIRTQEEYFRKNLKGKNFNDHEWVHILTVNPKLIQRPILEKEYSAIVGDPIENIINFLK